MSYSSCVEVYFTSGAAQGAKVWGRKTDTSRKSLMSSFIMLILIICD